MLRNQNAHFNPEFSATPGQGGALENVAQASETPTAEFALSKRYGFKIGRLNLLIPENEYCELITDFQVSLLPNSPKHMLGIINHRGNLIPLYKIPVKELEKNLRAYAFLIGKPKYGASLLIYGKPQPLSIPLDAPQAKQPNTAGWLEDCISDHLLVDNNTWCEINLRNLFRKLATTQ